MQLIEFRKETHMTVKGIEEHGCRCGKNHLCEVREMIVGPGVVSEIPCQIRKLGGKKAFLLADANTYAACGEKVEELLVNERIPYSKYVFEEGSVEPDESSVGSAFMHFDSECDLVIGVGSGVINDIAKILSNISHSKYIIVATAPSMDGYASATSSMAVDGLKVSLSSKCADVIIGDTDILKNAPMKSLQSGLGDIIAKYISIAEWRISNIINGEYYCEDIASLVRRSVKLCVDNAEGLKNRDNSAVEAVFNGLVLAGMAMSFAGASRPASGNEHYFSHIWDMRALEFGTAASTHGIQCAIGTLICAKLYDKLRTVVPDVKKASEYVENFDSKAWKEKLSEFLGRGAIPLIRLDEKEQKYSVRDHADRIKRIAENWDRIIEVVNEEVPPASEIERILDIVSCPKDPVSIGINKDILPTTFEATKDIRDKYILSRLVFDIGMMEDFKNELL